MQYKSPPIGNNISFIFYGVDKKFFSNPKCLENILRRGLKEDGLTALAWHTIPFGKDAYTMLVPLSESHLAIHTYWEHQSLAFNLYSCLSPSSGMKTYRRALREIKPEKHLLIRYKMPITIEEFRKFY